MEGVFKKQNKMKASKRFTSEKTARSFAKKVNGSVSDLRSHGERKSDFKVNYTKSENINECNNHDFDSSVNGNGTRWHTAEDL